jgi:hypothetical protein
MDGLGVGIDWSEVECSMGWDGMVCCFLYGYRGLEDSGHLTTFNHECKRGAVEAINVSY